MTREGKGFWQEMLYVKLHSEIYGTQENMSSSGTKKILKWRMRRCNLWIHTLYSVQITYIEKVLAQDLYMQSSTKLHVIIGQVLV